jgi:hypothetical protein
MISNQLNKNLNGEIKEIDEKLEILYAANRRLSSLRNDFLSHKKMDKRTKEIPACWKGKLKSDYFDAYFDEMIKSENNYNNIGYLTSTTQINRQIERLETLKRSKKNTR